MTLGWNKEKLRLLPLFDENGVFCRAGNLKYSGDSCTDMAALALFDGRVSAKYFTACQNSEGRMFRHPYRLEAWKRRDFTKPELECWNFSRDHVISLSYAALWSRNPELRQVCRRFFWYIVRNGGRFCPGTVGQGVVNPGVLAALLMACGGLFWLLGVLLYLVYIPWLHVSVNYAEKGYVRILHTEHAILAWRFGGIPLFAVQRIFNKCYEQEPQNLFYEFWANRGLSKLSSLRLRTMWANWTPECGKRGWAWTLADGRGGTGIDLCYLMCLSGIIRR